MNAEPFFAHVGEMADIVEGELVVSPSGFMRISESPEMGSLYLNRVTGFAYPLLPKTDYRGREFAIGRRDCIRLCAEWLDREMGLGTMSALGAVSRAKYLELMNSDLSLKLLEHGFKHAQIPERGDLLMYGRKNHTAIYLGGGKVLHHIAKRLSSVDPMDESKILGVFRHD